MSAVLWHHKIAAWCSNVEVGGAPITVHGMGPCLLDGYGLSYASIGGVTVSSGEFYSLPVYSVVVPSDMIYYG